jgi:hypothetical protein
METAKKTMIIKNAIYILGILCLIIFIITKSAFLLKYATLSDDTIGTRYGDLYQHARIHLFKEYLWRGEVSKKWEIQIRDADIIFMGDSYLTIEFSKDTYPHQTAKMLAKNISVSADFNSYQFVQNFLKTVQFTTQDEQKILIIESAERSVMQRFSAQAGNAQNAQLKQNESAFRKWLEPSIQWLRRIENVWFTNAEQRYYFFFRNNLLKDYLPSINDVRFSLFKEISPATPLYSINPPMLFYDKEIEMFNTYHSDYEIESIALTLKNLQLELLEKYNIKMVFLPVPGKYTIYHQLTNSSDKYDDFLPRLYKILDQYNIPVIKLYDPFKQSKELVYWGSDTHWNNEGIDIAAKKTAEAVNVLH